MREFARYIELRLRRIIRAQRYVVDIALGIRVVISDDRAARDIQAGVDACIDVNGAVVVFGVVKLDDAAGHVENGQRRIIVVVQRNGGTACPVGLVMRNNTVKHGKRGVIDIHARAAVLRVVITDGAAVHSDPSVVFDTETAAFVSV